MVSSTMERSAKRLKITSGTEKGVGVSQPVVKSKPADESSDESELETPREDIDSLERSDRLNKQFGLARAQMGNIPPGQYPFAFGYLLLLTALL